MINIQSKILNTINLKRVIWLFFLILLIFKLDLFSQKSTLNKISVYGDSLVILSFDGNIQYSSTLDTTKTRITLEIKNSSLSNSVNNYQNLGNIRQISSKTKTNNVIVDLNTNEPTGYTTFWDPLVKQLYINLFSWKELDESEDLYHTGLLSLEEGLDSIANVYLKQSLQKGYYKAANLLSINEFKLGRINRALKYSEIGEYYTGEFPQVLIIRATILNYRGDSAIAKRIENKYKQITNNDLIPLKIQKNRVDGDTLSISEIHLIDSLSQILMQSQSDTINSEFSRFDAIFDTTKKSVSDQKLAQSFFDSIPFWLQLVTGAFFAGIMLLLYFYFRWRTLQVKAKMSKTRQKAIEKYQTEKIKNKASKSKVPVSTIQQKYNPKPKQDDSPSQTSAQENISSITPEKASQIEIALQTIKQEKLKEQQDSLIEKQQSKQHSNAKIELATNLMNEQKKIKQQKIKNIPLDLVNKSNEIKQIANDLGLEESSLEIKKAVDNMIKDKSKIDKLTGKL